jgi:hypothetical protein
MSTENKTAGPSKTGEYNSAEIEIIDAIPEGMRLYTFPSHGDGPLCWCRPRVIFIAGEVVFEHKNLLNGEFDC